MFVKIGNISEGGLSRRERRVWMKLGLFLLIARDVAVTLMMMMNDGDVDGVMVMNVHTHFSG